MTLIVAISHADQFALITADSKLFVEVDGEWVPTEIPAGEKATRLTDYVLLGAAGDVAMADVVVDAIRAKVKPDDGITACRRAAQAAIDELWPIALELWPEYHRGREHAFISFVLNGFEPSGESAIATYAAGHRHVSPLYRDELLQLEVSCPYGVDHDEVQAFKTFAADEIPEALTIQGAFRHAFDLHHQLGRRYPDRISTDLRCSLLIREDQGGPMHVSFELDRDDIEGFSAAYWQLANLSAGQEQRAQA